VIVDHQGSGRFLEDNPESTNVPLNIRADTAELVVWILLPEGKEYRNFRVIRRDKEHGTSEPVNLVSRYLASDYSVIAFKLLSLKAGAALERQVARSEILLNGFGRPLVALADYIRQVLCSEYLLKELVREADVEWGRMYGERPFFEREGRPADPDDPYTVECVRNTLAHLIETLAASR
jgi:hypothetical protein